MRPPPTIIATGLSFSRKAGFLKWIVPGFSFGCSEAGSLKATEGGFGESVGTAGEADGVGCGVVKSAAGAAVVSGTEGVAVPILSRGTALGVSCIVAVASSGTSLMAC